MNKIDPKIILNYINGKYSYNDYLKIKDWFRNANTEELKIDIIENQWTELINQSDKEDASFNHLFEKIQYQILLDEKRAAKKLSLWSHYKRIAAILLIPVLFLSVWYYIFSHSPEFNNDKTAQNFVDISAPPGSRVSFMLPDSSRVWLNSESKITYPVPFNSNRIVELDGEAFFEVKHRPQSDFRVNVTDMEVKVLGTKFNVTAYKDDNFTNVVLNEGKVEIEGKRETFNYTMHPNEKITFNRQSKTLNVKNVDVSRFSAWRNGYLVIDNEPLKDVLSRIERWYNAEITIEDETLKNYRFKFTCQDEPLEEVLLLMSKTTPIKYEIQKRELDEYGVLKPKKVTMRTK